MRRGSFISSSKVKSKSNFTSQSNKIQMTIQRRDVTTPLISSAFEYDHSSDMVMSQNSLEEGKGWNTHSSSSMKNEQEGHHSSSLSLSSPTATTTTTSDGLSTRSSSNLYAMNSIADAASIATSSSATMMHLDLNAEVDRNSDEFNVSVGKYKEEMRKRRITGRGGCSRMCNYFVDKLQGIYLPARFSPYLPVSTSSDDNYHRDHFIHPTGRVPLFHGIDKVVNGTRPASEMVSICGIKPLRYFWYMLSGGACDIVQLAIDFFLLHVLHIQDPSICWALGFGMSIIVRHSSHRYLVFGIYVGGYWRSLGRMYAGYSIIIAISTFFNILMTKVLMLSHYTAWVATLLWTGIVNYFILKYIWSFDGKKKGGSGSSAGRNGSSAGVVDSLDDSTIGSGSVAMGGREIL